VLAEGTQAAQLLPGLGTRAALRYQRLLRAQWSGLAGWSFGLAHVRSQREDIPAEVVSSLSASTRVSDAGASVSMALTRTQGQGGRQNNLLLAVFFPLSAPDSRAATNRNRSVFVSQNNVGGTQLSRAQFTSSGQRVEDSVWGIGATRDANQTFSAVDGVWGTSTRMLDLSASGRFGQNDRSALVALRSALLWTQGQTFAARPINGAFAMVSTGEPGVSVFYENRQAGQTDASGLLLVPGLLAQQVNRLSVDPSTWPIHWLASQVERQVIPPRGGGVLVSFKINSMSWVSQPMVIPLSPAGTPYRAGTVAVSLEQIVSRTLEAPAEAVVDRRGQLWTAELAAAGAVVTRFAISQDGKSCRFTLPPNDSTAAQDAIQLTADACEDAP
jgi:outer membrane usher protein FimD/PapC